MFKNIYKYLPLILQNIALSVANIFVLYKKFGYIPFINSMKRIERDIKNNCPINEPETLLNRINDFKSKAVLKTNYYNRNNKNYPDLKHLRELEDWPILNKQYLKDHTSDFYSIDGNMFNVRMLSTSGSTGTPLKVKVGVKDLQKRFKIILKTMLLVGYSPSDCLARISGNDICDDKNIYRKDYVNNEVFLSAFHMTDSNSKKYQKAILDNNISAIEGYPSSIYLLAKILSENNIKITSVKNIFSTAEKLHTYQKDFIETFFKCRVYDYYGSNEQATFIYTCRKGRMHTSDKTGFVEVVDENNLPTKSGEFGRMLITSLTSHYMPLIRYDIGDTCIVSSVQYCECGEAGIIIDEIIGRDEEIFKTRTGQYITRFSLYLKHLPNFVNESQIILNTKTTQVKLLFTTSIEPVLNSFSVFETLIKEKLGSEYVINYMRVDKIPLTLKGKKKAVIIES